MTLSAPEALDRMALTVQLHDTNAYDGLDAVLCVLYAYRTVQYR